MYFSKAATISKNKGGGGEAMSNVTRSNQQNYVPHLPHQNLNITALNPIAFVQSKWNDFIKPKYIEQHFLRYYTTGVPKLEVVK